MSSDSFGNTRYGTNALPSTGPDLSFNTAIGYNALFQLASGVNNTAIGYNAGSLGNFSNTTSIGANTNPSADNQVVLGSTGTTVIAQNLYLESISIPIDSSTNSFGFISSAAGTLYNKLVSNDDIASNANIANSKLAIINTPGLVDNLATSATTSNIPLSIVSRDGSGNIIATTQSVDPITSDDTVATTLYVNNLLNVVSSSESLPATIARRDENGDLYASNFYGNLTGDVFGNLTGDITGNLFGNVLGNFSGDILGNLTGNVLGNLNGNVTGDVCGTLRGDVFGNLYGGIIGDVTGNVHGNVIGNLSGNVTGSLFGSVTGSVSGSLVGDVTGNVHGNVSGTLHGSVTGSLIGDVTGNLFGDVNGDVNGNLTGNVNGNVNGSLNGNVIGNLSGNVNGSLNGNVIGNLSGNVSGFLNGNVTGDLFGDVTGTLHGNVTGTLHGIVTGNLRGNVIGNLSGNVIGNVTGSLFGNATTASSSSNASNSSTQPYGTSNNSIATTEFVQNAINNIDLSGISYQELYTLEGFSNNLITIKNNATAGILQNDVSGNVFSSTNIGNVSGNLTGNASSASTSSTQPLGTSNTSIATTQFVQNSLNAYSPVINTVLIDASMCDSSGNYSLPSPPYSNIYVKNGDIYSTTLISSYEYSVDGPSSVAFVGKDTYITGNFWGTGVATTIYGTVTTNIGYKLDENNNMSPLLNASSASPGSRNQGLVYDMISVGTDLYIVGNFNIDISGVTQRNIAKYDTLTGIWYGVGLGQDQYYAGWINSVLYYDNKIYIAGKIQGMFNPDGTTIGANSYVTVSYYDLLLNTWVVPGINPSSFVFFYESMSLTLVGTNIYYSASRDDNRNIRNLYKWNTVTNIVNTTPILIATTVPELKGFVNLTYDSYNNLLWLAGSYQNVKNSSGTIVYGPVSYNASTTLSLLGFDMNETDISSNNFRYIGGPTFNAITFASTVYNNKLYLIGPFYYFNTLNQGQIYSNGTVGDGFLMSCDLSTNIWSQIPNSFSFNALPLQEPFMYKIKFQSLNETMWVNCGVRNSVTTNEITLRQGNTSIITLDNPNPYALVASTQAAGKTFVTPFNSSLSTLIVI
jgi:hypothetical protein